MQILFCKNIIFFFYHNKLTYYLLHIGWINILPKLFYTLRVFFLNVVT